MKKLFALLLAAAMACSMVSPAFAEKKRSTYTRTKLELSEKEKALFPFDGELLDFPDAGFFLYLPSDWIEEEREAEDVEKTPNLYAFHDEERKEGMVLSWRETAFQTNQELYEAFKETYDSTYLLKIGYNNFVMSMGNTSNTIAFMCVVPTHGGLFRILFPSINEESWIDAIMCIMESLTFYKQSTK